MRNSLSIVTAALVHGPDPENLDIGTIRGGNSTIHFWKADILGFLKNPVGRVNVAAWQRIFPY